MSWARPVSYTHLLAGFGIAHGQEAVGKDVLGQGLANGHEHGGPNDAVAVSYTPLLLAGGQPVEKGDPLFPRLA